MREIASRLQFACQPSLREAEGDAAIQPKQETGLPRFTRNDL
jgi:hypothetical protein